MIKLKHLQIAFIIAAVLFPLLDVMSTIVFVSELGIQAEANPIARYFMYTFGGMGFVFMYLFAVSGWLMLYLFYTIIIPRVPWVAKQPRWRVDRLVYMIFAGVVPMQIGLYTFILVTNLT